ncbi:MAG TPA: periplasmic heavy metal sensor [Terriglobales bacterium]|jgi:Spy/CpxP family protein refolding chaperone|nr:periplasmic heavy metal sensor [Terriglobales bacterium]
MKTRFLLVSVVLISALWAQTPAPQAGPTWTQAPETAAPGLPGGKTRIIYRREMGKWWQNSETAKKLQLSEGQISQLDEIFLEHRLKLIDYGAAMEKQDLKLQSLLDADVPDEAQINTQVDQVLAARGKLEREYTMMNLDLRKVLSLEQWRQLKSLRGESGAFGDRIFFRKFAPPPGVPGVPGVAPLPPLAPLPPPPPDGDEMF